MPISRNLLIPLVIIAIMPVTSQAASLWGSDVLSSYGVTLGGGMSLALDASGNAGLTWYGAGGGLYYASQTDNVWGIAQQLESNYYAGMGSDLEYLGSTPYISYRGADASNNGSLNFTTWDGAAWNTAIIDNSAGINPNHTDIELDINGLPAISWVEQYTIASLSDDRILYAYHDGTDWSAPEIVNPSPDPYARPMAGANLGLIGSNTTPDIAYASGSGFTRRPIFSERIEGGIWTDNIGLDGTASSYSAAYMALAYDPDGNPMIAFMDTVTGTTPDTRGDVCLATYKDGAWSVERVFNSTAVAGYNDYSYLDMAVDSFGQAHILFYDPQAQELLYTVRVEGSWSAPRTIYTGEAYFAQLELDSKGRPHYSYISRTSPTESEIRYGVGQSSIPEPGTMLLFAAGVAAIALRARRRRVESESQE